MAALLLWPRGVISCQDAADKIVTEAESLSRMMSKASLSRIRQLSGSMMCQCVRSSCYAKKTHQCYIDYGPQLKSNGPQVFHFNKQSADLKDIAATSADVASNFPAQKKYIFSTNSRDQRTGTCTCSKMAPEPLCVRSWRVIHAAPKGETVHVDMIANQEPGKDKYQQMMRCLYRWTIQEWVFVRTLKSPQVCFCIYSGSLSSIAIYSSVSFFQTYRHAVTEQSIL